MVRCVRGRDDSVLGIIPKVTIYLSKIAIFKISIKPSIIMNKLQTALLKMSFFICK